MKRVGLILFLLCSASVLAAPSAAAWPDSGKHMNHRLHMGGGGQQPGRTDRVRVKNFEVLGHHDLGATDTNGDVWVHGNFAYVGTWGSPCTGGGAKIVDVTDPRAPKLIGRLGARPGTSAEDIVVRRVSTPFFTGDLLAVGIQRCGDDPALDTQEFGTEFWDVTNPYAPTKLGEANVAHGGGGTHELDMVQRGGTVVALLANPFLEWFDPVPRGDFTIVDATNPRMPVELADWGAGAHGLSPGPFFGIGSFGASFAHSLRASDDGTKAYASYWDLGVITFDITNLSNPTMTGRTLYPHGQDGDAHSMTPYQSGGRSFILQNDEDLDPRSPADIRYGRKGRGLGNESPGGTPLWLERGHRLNERVVKAANQGCESGDYPAGTAGKIAVVYTPFPFFDPEGGDEPLCEQQQQEAAAEAAGAAAVVHDFVSSATSPQWFDFGEVDIPVLFTDHATAQGMVAEGRAVLEARKPSWGFLRVFDAATGQQVTTFDNLPGVHKLPAPPGDFTIHNTEVVGKRAYVSWYTNGIVALDLTPLDHNKSPKLVGSFIPPAGESRAGFPDVTDVWGVVIRPSDNLIFGSDMNTGLWIVRATGPAAP